ncbi:MAG TPA: hypothetical protein VLC11_07550, partial [Gemmatimonadales bacterium]|nr:hypothetical protein [Gemmatimonadales bacterium]
MPLCPTTRSCPPPTTEAIATPSGGAALRVPLTLLLVSLFTSYFSLFTPLSAQTPAQRDSIEAFRDSLAPISDTVALRALEAHYIEIAKQDRKDPMRHLRLGFIA